MLGMQLLHALVRVLCEQKMSESQEMKLYSEAHRSMFENPEFKHYLVRARSCTHVLRDVRCLQKGVYDSGLVYIYSCTRQLIPLNPMTSRHVASRLGCNNPGPHHHPR